ncbi:MBL fold metallo-hydrolase [candidate division KSB3 bacterium]|uniref:MBL fold metallo-hydrolase n=1 Tax=candidate division KSB3 bacterium TaxID=2044937 RepID=A0A9D5JWT0_9BACT|nr:MBL fold metallo-hydrolase [candidate division KSB3 bacterium]MBD3325570.1 MBL fold metallo-hydrolase [candidate division KSB3 bacterium]
MKVTFWGVRGSIPTPGKKTVDVGGNTACVSINADDGTLLIFDAGTGIRSLGLRLMKDDFGQGGKVGHLFFSHTHWDHIQGFPFFIPAFIGAKDEQKRSIKDRTNTFHLYGAKKVFERLENTLRGQMEYQYFPIELDSMGSDIHFHEIQEVPLQIGENTIIPQQLNHPNGVLAYRIENSTGDKVVVYATDTEHYEDGELDVNVLKIADHADIFIYDAMYTPGEYAGNPNAGQGSKVGWGHSTWLEGTRLAKTAHVKQLVLFHHDPDHSDAFLREIEKQARAEFPNTLLAVEGLELEI